MHMTNAFHLAVKLLIAFAIGCFGVVNAKMQVAYIDIEKNEKISMSHHEMMQTHCMDPDDGFEKNIKKPHQHKIGCIDCQILHCQNTNYAFADHKAVVNPLFANETLIQPPSLEYHSVPLSGYLQEILRPPRV